MEPMLENVRVSKVLWGRELAIQKDMTFSLDENVLTRVTIHPKVTLTEERARHIFGELFVSRREVTAAFNALFKRSVQFFRLEEEGEVAFTATEEQAAHLADGSWVCLFLPDIPFAILLELFRSLDVPYKEQWLRTLGNFVQEMSPSDGHDFINRLCSVGARNAPGYVFLSREEAVNVQMGDSDKLFRVEKVGFSNIWTIVLLQLALGRPLIKSCSYAHFKMAPNGSLVFAEKRPGEEKLLGLEMLGFARPV
ncbi:hypothetical protein HZB94_00555 [Candidatus Falkowbacteria bacterium]|nr:hypothetical protein [Candidatus Falkowbacteria bacterium]